jgi:acetyl esterase/lipase
MLYWFTGDVMRRVGLLLTSALLIGSFASASLVNAQATVEVITSTKMRLRVGPGTNFTALLDVPPGTSLVAFARDDGANWVHVSYQTQLGWLAVAYLRYKGNIRTLPVGEGVPPPAPGTPPATSSEPVEPTPVPDGTIVSLDKYGESDSVDYYRIIYMSGGLKIAGFYAEPKAEGSFPAVIYNRGGNRATGRLYGFEFVPFAESGFVVVASQYRGCCGGEGRDQLGGADVDDVVNLIPLLKSRPKVDASRIAIFGSSRGAMMAYIALRRQTESGGSDIKVAATTSGLSDLIAWTKERSDLDRGVYRELVGATTRSNPAAFQARSAVYWPELIKVPILIQHGDGDRAVSVKQSQTLADKIALAGGTVRLVILPGGDHGLNNYDFGMRETLNWFQHYLGRPGDDFQWESHKETIIKIMRKLDPR